MDKPGEKALIAMKESGKQIVVFKKPKDLPKKKKHIILTEDRYVEELGKIIQRDFFPDLEKLKAQNEYLDAISSNDIVKLRQIFAKYSSRRPSMDTPATFDTPASLLNSTPRPGSEGSQSVRSNSTTKSSSKSISDNHTLDSFLDKYTSEDNQSFEEIIEAADVKLKQKFAILYEAEIQQSELLENSLALPSIEKQFDAIEKPKNVDTWTYKNKNYIMYIPDGVDFTQEEKIEMARKKQEIKYTNTRLILNPFNDSQNKETISEVAKTQSRLAAEKVGFDGNVIQPPSPQIRGFNFVKSPSPCPGLSNESPMMTWGEIQGTPFRLDAGDTPLRPATGPSFHIAENSKRETLAFQLAESASEKHRTKKLKALEAAKKSMCASPHIRNSLERLNSMSPAARRLTSGKFGIRDTFLLTPSPRISKNKTPFVTTKTRSNKTTPSPLVRKQTPLVKRSGTESTEILESTLTDNLLDIPTTKRPKASDFF